MTDAPEVNATWVDLVDIDPQARVLLVDGAGRRAEASLRRVSTDVTVVAGSAFGSAIGPAIGSVDGRSFDVVCLDQVDVAALPQQFWDGVRTDRAVVVVVGDTRTSPLRVLDRVTRRDSSSERSTSSRQTRGRAVRRLRARGLTTHQAFGLLRSGDAPVVAFDALAGSSLAAVLGSTRAHVDGWRGTALNGAARLPASQVLRLCPAWLVVAGGAGPAADRVVGKVSNRDSEEIKILRGDPVSAVERRFLVDQTNGEVAALRELELVGFARAPRVLGEPTPAVSRCSWLPGATLALDRLDEDSLARWVGRAAEVLAEIQDLTRRSDGTVLVHGDFWLGNLLTSGDQVTAVVDWTESYRGPADVDREFLITSLARWVDSDVLRTRLEQVRDAALSG